MILDAIVVPGMQESEAETERTERVSEITHITMELPSVTVVSAVRLGKQPAAEGRPRKLLVKLGSQKQAVEVLTSARRLIQLKIERKANSESPMGISRNLSPAELQHRSSVWAAFRAAKQQKRSVVGSLATACTSMALRCCQATLCLSCLYHPDNMR